MKHTHIVFFCIVVSLQSLLAFNDSLSRWERMIRLKRQSGETCVLPPYPDNGVYSVAGAPNARPGQTLPTFQLTVTCHPGYKPKGRDVALCVAGVWSAEIAQCVRHCRLTPHASVQYRCSVSEDGFDGFRDCNEYEPAGTTVRPQCNKPNYYYNGVKTLMRCIDGRWDHVVICTADCGRATPSGKPLLIGGKEVQRGELPWHAGIYLKPNGQGEGYQQICGGSIISTRVVISAAHCFWSRGRARPVTAVAVAVGKLYRKWNEPRDDDAQKFDALEIKIPVRYQDEATNYQDDIAAVTLSAEVVYRPHVRPVCLDFDPVFDRTQLKPGVYGKVAGWGFTDTAGTPSPVLKVLDLPYVSVVQCIEESPPSFRPFITSDKICAGFQNGSAVCRGDSGGGLVFPTLDRGSERYYLRGIVSTAPKSDDECNAYARASFTQVLVHAAFIEDITVQVLDNGNHAQPDATSLPCVLPPYPRNGMYSVAGTPGAVPGQTFLNAQLEIKCNPGFITERNVSPSCSYGRWSDSIPDCVAQCALPEDLLTYKCSKANGLEYDCAQIEPSGVTARLLCNGKPSQGVECVDGQWNGPLTCDQECGRSYPSSGVDQPWVAAVYGNENGVVRYLCGGTIVKPTVVFTAAHCVWDNARRAKGEASNYFVAAGITIPDWQDTREVSFRQQAALERISFPAGFVGFSQSKGSDLAALHLSTPLAFNDRVQPACLDLDFKYVPRDLNQVAGKAATWSIITRGQVILDIAKLRSVNVVHMKFNDCMEQLDEVYQPYLTPDKLCVRITSNRGICQGDSGLGFLVPATVRGVTRYYLRGTSSLGFSKGRCDTRDPSGMTDIAYMADFVRENLV